MLNVLQGSVGIGIDRSSDGAPRPLGPDRPLGDHSDLTVPSRWVYWPEPARRRTLAHIALTRKPGSVSVGGTMGFEFRSQAPESIFDRATAASITELFRGRFGQSLKLGKRRGLFQRSHELPWPAWEAMQKLAVMKVGEDGARHLNAVDAWLGVYLPVVTEPEAISLETSAGPQIEVSGGGSIDPQLLTAVGGVLEKLKREMPAPMLQIASLPAAHSEAGNVLSTLDIPAEHAAVRTRLAGAQREGPGAMGTWCLCSFYLAASKALEDGVPVWLVK